MHNPCETDGKKIDSGRIKIEFETGDAKDALRGALVLLKENQ
ncbi:MAG: hypothetical protein WKF36_10720 [Candidatus Nitrosocosmicus sp.]